MPLFSELMTMLLVISEFPDVNKLFMNTMDCLFSFTVAGFMMVLKGGREYE